VPNIEKRAKLPGDWLATAFPTAELRGSYLRDNDLDGLTDFLKFYAQRRERMRQRLLKTLGVTEPSRPPAGGLPQDRQP
jgi:hypothetical protein